MAIKKNKAPVGHPTDSHIKESAVRDSPLRFSFQLFDTSDGEMCPQSYPAGYTIKLMERLKALSSWTIGQFCGLTQKAVRNHSHNWAATQRPNGFSHLNEQYLAIEGWQFELTANEHGRVHGIIIDDVFYVIWLDVNHALYHRTPRPFWALAPSASAAVAAIGAPHFCHMVLGRAPKYNAPSNNNNTVDRQHGKALIQLSARFHAGTARHGAVHHRKPARQHGHAALVVGAAVILIGVLQVGKAFKHMLERGIRQAGLIEDGTQASR